MSFAVSNASAASMSIYERNKQRQTGSSHQPAQIGLAAGMRVQVTLINGVAKKGKITSVTGRNGQFSVTILFDDGTSDTVSHTRIRFI
ncbi:hypothetical protein AURDEDRAFT_162232 [Auricularia subglabra TFB-10046 SS5]|nr:hypothetical protein AURDEDRAFT_162232 [Auricularia subglabra TFB-10046 SS5]